MKEYIRTTHNFNNSSREWEYRRDKGGDKYNDSDWMFPVIPPIKWSLGVHALRSDRYSYLRTIIDETILYFSNDGQFKEKFLKTENIRDAVRKDILKELEILIKLDMVRAKEVTHLQDDSYWNF